LVFGGVPMLFGQPFTWFGDSKANFGEPRKSFGGLLMDFSFLVTIL
jgi:hypothetical protein